MSRIAKGLARAGVAVVSLAGFTACGSAQLAMAPHVAHRAVQAGCVIPGTDVTVPSMSGAQFYGAAYSCVNGAWEPFSAKDNQR